MKLTKQQQSVMDRILSFLESDASVFVLKGYAGTGKTTMVKEIVEKVQDASQRNTLLMAPTGRAARVLQEKTGYSASTIHRAIYEKGRIESKRVGDLQATELRVHFDVARAPRQSLVIVDEASMLSSKTNRQDIYEFGTDNLMNDLLTFARPIEGGKILFVGDPAQLPPVGDKDSMALSVAYFEELGLKVETAELTEVLRQKGESLILKNAMQIRQLLQEERPNRLVFDERKGEVETLAPESLLPTYLAAAKEHGRENCVLICFSNREASGYNAEIRKHLYGASGMPLCTQDPLMVVQNNYALDMMNGEFTHLLSIDGTEEQSAPIYVEKAGKRERVIMNLHFASVTIADHKGNPQPCMLLLDLLNNDRPSISVDEQKALYINFCMRHPKLNQGSEEFINVLMQDAYYNCLRVKYGYAITGHKCQGGEWKNAFVDYSGRTGLKPDCLRWTYTATTRAAERLYVVNLPHITPFSKFRIEPVQQCSKVNAECRLLGKVQRSPFHAADAPDFLCAKWMCISQNLAFTPYRVHHVLSKPYQEIYFIETPDSVERYDVRYKKGGLFLKAVAQVPSKHTPLVLMALNNERAMPIVFHYEPSSSLMQRLYDLIRSACDGLNIRITNVVEHPEDYSVIYYFNTSDTMSYIKIYVNSSGFVTYAKPMSLIGVADHELKNLIVEIQNHFE